MNKKSRPQKPVLIDEQLRQAITEGGWTAYRLGPEARVAVPVISRFLNEDRDLRLKTAAKLAVVLGLELRPISKPKGKP